MTTTLPISLILGVGSRVAAREAASMAVVLYFVASVACSVVGQLVHTINPSKYIQRDAVPKHLAKIMSFLIQLVMGFNVCDWVRDPKEILFP